MSKTVTIGSDQDDELIQLPNGFAYGAGESVVLTDEQYGQISPSAFEDGIVSSEQGGIFQIGNSNYQSVAIPVDLSDVADADAFSYTPNFAGSIVGVRFVPTTVTSTAGKKTTLTTKIGTTALTGGIVRLSTKNCSVAGVPVPGSRITALNHFAETDTINVVAGSTTAFVEGKGYLVLDLVPSTTAVASRVDFIGGGLAIVRWNVSLASVADGTVEAITPGIAGTIKHVRAIVTTAVTTAAKASTLNLDIGGTNVTNGTVALTSAAATPAGKVIDNASAPSANNALAIGDTLTLEASSTTAFVEGAVTVEALVVLS